MSVKVSFKAIVKEIQPINTILSGAGNEKETRIQNLILTQPGYTDEFGEKKGKDEHWCIQLINKKIDDEDIKTKLHTGDKVAITCFFNSNEFETKTDKRIGYSINANYHSVEMIEQAPPF